MIKKRLSAVVNVLDGQVVQSVSFNTYYPIGSPRAVLVNLDRWNVDEIIILSIHRTKYDLGPDYELLSAISSLRLSTPLIYGGGIRDASDAIRLVSLGADRLVIGDLLHTNPNSIYEIIRCVGTQAVIASIVFGSLSPFQPYSYQSRQPLHLSTATSGLLSSSLISELLLMDMHNEGLSASWSDLTLSDLPPSVPPVIPFGGLTNPDDVSTLLSRNYISAVAIGNSFLYKEHAYQRVKNHLATAQLRTSYYSPLI